MFSSDTTQVSDGGYQISRSLRFNSADSTSLSRTPSTTTNRRTFTFSAWVKLSKTSDDPFLMGAGSGGQIWFLSDKMKVRLSGSPDYYYDTAAVFRDYSAWYHIVVGVDTTNATSTDRVKIYVNGTQQTIGASAAPPQNYDTEFNLASTVNNIGQWPSGGQRLNGYMTEVNFIDGQALTPSSFGETNAQTGVWQPKAYSGSYGTNGFYLNFSDNSNTTAATLGKDYSGNGNNWTPNNFSVTAGAGNDSLVDSPTSYGTDTGVGGTVRGNYATLNPLLAITTSGVTNPTLSNGNLNFVGNASTDTSGRSTIGMTSGTWYAEITISYVSAIQDGVGIAYTQSDSSRSFGVLYRTNGNKLIDNTASAYGSSYAAGDVIGIAVDATNNQITFYKNGTSQGAISFTPTTAIYFSTYGTNASPAFAGDINFGQRPFAYTAPSGYKALCTQNLPTPTIGATNATQAGKYFNPVLYTGTGSDNRAVTGVGFQPDFVWVKGRDIGQSHVLNNAVAGVGTAKTLYSNLSVSQGTYDDYGYLQSLDADGYTIKNGSINGNLVNASGYQYVAWNWKANGSGSTNTAGSITSTVSANTTSGFSIVTYTGTGANATVGHGLGVAPSFIIVKRRDAGSSWNCYQANLGASQYIQIDGTAGAATNTGVWNNTAPTSTVFSIGTAFAGVNASGSTHVAYCFAPIAGYSAFGSYTGNGSADGPFVYCGFRPAFVLIKNSTSTSGPSWQVRDSARIGYNSANYTLYPNLSNAEYSTSGNYEIDFLSNGFKIRTATDAGCNGSGDTMIFAAFASAPLKYSLAR